MDITFDLLPDPLYHPLPPSIDDVLTYASELEEEGNNITFKWADHEIKNHLLSYVRVGLVAYKVKLYRLYRHSQQKFKTFQEYCEKGLGKSPWVVNKLINAANITLELAKAGFTQLPQCEAQARPLTKFTGDTLTKKWQEVIDSTPPHRITATHVSTIVDDEPQNPKKRVSIDKNTYNALAKKANAAGMTAEELLRELVDNYNPQPEEPQEDKDNPEESDDPEAIEPVTPAELEKWLLDTQQLLIEHYGLSFSPISNSS